MVSIDSNTYYAVDPKNVLRCFCFMPQFFPILALRFLNAIGLVLTLADIKGNAPNAQYQQGAATTVRGAKGARDNAVSLTLHGPQGLSEFYRSTRHFMYRDDFRVSVDSVKVWIEFVADVVFLQDAFFFVELR